MPIRDQILREMQTDAAVKKKLDEGGDDERAVHEITYQLLADSEPPILEAIEIAGALLFTSTPVSRTRAVVRSS